MADLTLSSGYRKGFNNYRAVGLLCLTLCLVLHQIRIIHLASISNRRSERTKCSRTVLPVSHFLLAYTRVWLEGARASPCSKCLLLIFSWRYNTRLHFMAGCDEWVIGISYALTSLLFFFFLNLLFVVLLFFFQISVVFIASHSSFPSSGSSSPPPFVHPQKGNACVASTSFVSFGPKHPNSVRYILQDRVLLPNSSHFLLFSFCSQHTKFVTTHK